MHYTYWVNGKIVEHSSVSVSPQFTQADSSFGSSFESPLIGRFMGYIILPETAIRIFYYDGDWLVTIYLDYFGNHR